MSLRLEQGERTMLLGKLSKATKAVGAFALMEARETKEAAKEVYWFVRRHDWIRTAKIVFRRKYWSK